MASLEERGSAAAPPAESQAPVSGRGACCCCLGDMEAGDHEQPQNGNANSHGQVSQRPRKDRWCHLLRFHLHDWLILLALIIFYGILNLIEPFHRHINRYVVNNLTFPLNNSTVPFWSVPLYALILPILVISILYCVRRDPRDFHHAILGLVYTIFITAVLTDIVKVSTGRPRPDFMRRCFPGGPSTWTFDDAGDGNVICSPLASKSDIKQGYKSFPSGHTSWSFAGLGYLSWYLAGKLGIYDRHGFMYKLTIALFPLLLATLVGISLVDNYWHHWQDVVVGGLLGLAVATVIYHLHFYPLCSSKSGQVYHRAIRGSNNTDPGESTFRHPLAPQSDVETATLRG